MERKNRPTCRCTPSNQVILLRPFSPSQGRKITRVPQNLQSDAGILADICPYRSAFSVPLFFVRRYRPQIDVLALDDNFLVRFPVAHVKRV